MIASDAHRVFHALGDATRRAIIERLSSGPASVSHLAGPLDVTVTAVSQHLQVLEDCGLVHTEKTGRVRTARLGATGFQTAEQWLRYQQTRWNERLDQLGDLLDED